jgi:hypothetical protein
MGWVASASGCDAETLLGVLVGAAGDAGELLLGWMVSSSGSVVAIVLGVVAGAADGAGVPSLGWVASASAAAGSALLDVVVEASGGVGELGWVISAPGCNAETLLGPLEGAVRDCVGELLLGWAASSAPGPVGAATTQSNSASGCVAGCLLLGVLEGPFSTVGEASLGGGVAASSCVGDAALGELL